MLTLRPPTRRGLAALFMIVTYLLAGALHGLCDVEASNTFGRTAVSVSITRKAGSDDKGFAAEHHCHGCFAVSVPSPLLTSSAIKPRSVMLAQPETFASGVILGIDTPPPKLLT